jgi:hypothetical protein
VLDQARLLIPIERVAERLVAFDRLDQVVEQEPELLDPLEGLQASLQNRLGRAVDESTSALST